LRVRLVSRWDAQTLHGPAQKDVLAVNFLGIGCGNTPVPNTFWIDHHDGALNADIETSRFVNADLLVADAALFA
jgi:hypothetical protein